MDTLAWIRAVGPTGLIDIALMAALIYTALSWTRKTRASSALVGIVILAVGYLAARQFGLVLVSTVFEQFFAIILIALIVIFQGELRTVFEQIAALGVRGVRGRGRRPPGPDTLSSLLARTAFELARARVGALVVIPGEQPIDPHVSDGIPLDGQISVPLIKSIFDHHSPGHDGALVIQGDRIARFAVHLPLSSNVEARGDGGTRHAAALGLTERTDALCIVVSEERGAVSIAHHGELLPMEREATLFDALEERLLRAPRPPRPRAARVRGWTRNWRTKLASLGVAVAMWIVLVQGSTSVYRTFSAPVRVAGATSGDTVVTPDEVRVTLRGPLRAFWMMRGSSLIVRLEVDPLSGATEVPVTPDALSRPKDVAVERIDPGSVRVAPAVPTPHADRD